jgi:hypothetical protein
MQFEGNNIMCCIVVYRYQRPEFTLSRLVGGVFSFGSCDGPWVVPGMMEEGEAGTGCDGGD